MATHQNPSRSRGGLEPGESSPSFAQTTAEFNLFDSDEDEEFDQDEDERSRRRETEIGGGKGEIYEMKETSRTRRPPSRPSPTMSEMSYSGDGWVDAGVGGGIGGGGGGGGGSTSPDSSDAIRMGLSRRASASTVASFQLYTPDEEQAVVRKFDRKLVLFVALLFMMSFLDRSSMRMFFTVLDLPRTPASAAPLPLSLNTYS
jgi:hypothetical protein